MRCIKARAKRPLAPKASSAAAVTCDGGEWCRSRPLRGCPWLSLGTAQDRCEWHACGTASEEDPRTPWRRWLRLDRRVRLVLGDHRLVGKSPEDSRQLFRSRRVADAS